MFDTPDLTWRLNEKKLGKTRAVVSEAVNRTKSNLKSWQKLTGRLNDLSQMCTFMKVFRHTIFECMEENLSSAPDNTVIYVSDDACRDLKVWENFSEVISSGSP
jgi:hypothetical protein